MWKIVAGIAGVAVLAFLLLRHDRPEGETTASIATSTMAATSGTSSDNHEATRTTTTAQTTTAATPVEVRFTNYESTHPRFTQSTTGTIVVYPHPASTATSK